MYAHRHPRQFSWSRWKKPITLSREMQGRDKKNGTDALQRGMAEWKKANEGKDRPPAVPTGWPDFLTFFPYRPNWRLISLNCPSRKPKWMMIPSYKKIWKIRKLRSWENGKNLDFSIMFLCFKLSVKEIKQFKMFKKCMKDVCMCVI